MIAKFLQLIAALALTVVCVHQTAMSQAKYRDAVDDTTKRVVINNYYYGPPPYYAKPVYPYFVSPLFRASFFVGFHRPIFIHRFPVAHRFHPRMFGFRRMGGRRY